VQPVSLRLDRDVAWIEFGDPAARNLLTVPLLDAVPPALAEAARRGARVVVLRGRGPVFSAGYDIAQIPADLFDADPRAALAHPFERCMRAVVDCPLPTLAAVNGHAVGGAVELAISCDLRIARSGARFGITAARLGLVYPHTGLEKLVRVVGAANARRLLFTGDLVEAEEARHVGLVHVERDAPLAGDDIRRILALRQQSYQSRDFAEGRAAFEAKRDPRFEGR
jgi:enoyl-CoA hydratase/carnithine racemase